MITHFQSVTVAITKMAALPGTGQWPDSPGAGLHCQIACWVITASLNVMKGQLTSWQWTLSEYSQPRSLSHQCLIWCGHPAFLFPWKHPDCLRSQATQKTMEGAGNVERYLKLKANKIIPFTQFRCIMCI